LSSFQVIDVRHRFLLFGWAALKQSDECTEPGTTVAIPLCPETKKPSVESTFARSHYVTLTRHSPQSVHCATPFPNACGVLETPPLPVSPPPCGDRELDLMAESSLLMTFSSTTCDLVSQ
jgi:hypothetical protein